MKKILTGTLLVATMLLGGLANTHAATTSKLNTKQVKSLLNIAIKSTNTFIDSKAIESTLTLGGEKFVYRMDRSGNVQIVDPASGVTYLFGFDTYTSMKNKIFAEEELEIIRSLKLNENALWAHVDIRKVTGEDPQRMLESFKDEVLGMTHYNLTDTTLGVVEYTVTSAKLTVNSSNKIMTTTWKNRDTTGNTTITMDSKNIITQVRDVQTDIKTKAKTSKIFTLKNYTFTITKPQDNYLEWGNVYMDPRYKTYIDLRLANSTLGIVFREIVATAKMNNRSEVTTEDVFQTLSSGKHNYLKAYGLAVEYSFIGAIGAPALACGALSTKFNFASTTDPSSVLTNVTLAGCATLGYLPSPARL